MIDGAAAVWRSRDRGDSWTRLSNGLPQQGAYLGVLREAMATDKVDQAGVYFGTSTGQLFRQQRRGRALVADRRLPAAHLVGRSRRTSIADGSPLMATVNLPRSLVALFADQPPRHLDMAAPTLGELVTRLDERWPGMRDRVCEAVRSCASTSTYLSTGTASVI
jgi:hypothetical protein